jgi:hypothetical protein
MGFERREELAPTGFGVGRSFGQSRPFSVAIDLPQRHAVATRHQLVIVAVSTGQSQAAPAGAFGDRGAFDPGLFRGIGEFGQTDVSPLGESELTALIGEHADRCSIVTFYLYASSKGFASGLAPQKCQPPACRGYLL